MIDNNKANAAVDTLVSTLRNQGQVWARYGLTVGKLALETNARALSQLAESLGKFAESFETKPSEAAPSDPAPSTVEADVADHDSGSSN